MRLISVAVLAVGLSACGITTQSGTPAAAGAPGQETFEGPVPKAACGPGAVEETGLQGQVSKEDRASGRSREGYSCNLEQIGQFQGDGASWQFTWYEDCGYYDTSDSNNSRRDPAIIGSVTLDVTDPTQPVATKYLQTPGMIDPWESLKVNDRALLLAAVEQGGPALDIYDIAGDCRQPVLVFTGDMAGASGAAANGHAGDFARNGQTYYGAAFGQRPFAYDVRDPAHPKVLAEPAQFPADTGTHDLATNPEGTRLYFAKTGNPNGLQILDVTDVQNQAAEPVISTIGSVFWTDGATAQQTLHILIGGKPFILFTDEGGQGAARLIDIGDETAPVIASKLKLEVHMPENDNAIAGDTATGGGTFGYEGHYCGVDDPANTTTVACGMFQSGIRVFDVRDPWHPAEIAYFYPQLLEPTTQLPGSQNNRATTAPYCSSQVRLIAERGELWTTCQDNGFLALKFTNGVWPFKD